MPGNSEFILVGESGWRRGLNNLLDNEFAGWWKTRMWWIQCLIWTCIPTFILGNLIINSKNFDFTEGIMFYSIFAGVFPAIGVVVIMQDALVGEKSTGTIAWVLSKPVARPAIILSKLVSNSVGVLTTMVVVPGAFMYVLLSIASKTLLNPLTFIEAWGIIFLCHLFYLTYTLMLGAFFNSRGPVIGLALGLLFLQQYLIGLLPIFRYLLPWTLAIPLNNENNAIVPNLLAGQMVTSYLPLLGVAVECVLFVLISLWRFNREEF